MTMQSTMIGEDVEASHEVSGLAPTNFLFSLHEMRENQENSTIVIGFVAIHVATGMSIPRAIDHPLGIFNALPPKATLCTMNSQTR